MDKKNLENRLQTILFYAAKDGETAEDVLAYLEKEGETDADFAKMHKMFQADLNPKHLAPNARKKLGTKYGQRLRFSATVIRFGKKTAFKGPDLDTILLGEVRIAGETPILAEHLWFTCGKWSKTLKVGDDFSFDARVGSYEKGYRGYRDDVWTESGTDFRLERPTKIKIHKGDKDGM